MVQICYTNSKTSDVWDMFYEQNQNNCPYPLYLISDKNHENKKYKNVFLYRNDIPYWKAWYHVLVDLNPEYFIYLQEDFILYDLVNDTKIKEYEYFLKNNKDFSFVRLIKTGNCNSTQIQKTLFALEPNDDFIFAMQPTIWRTKDFLKLYKEVACPYWYLEHPYKEKCIQLNIKGAYHYAGEQKRGQNHWDSNVYPYVATALVKGKWNFGEYGSELTKLCSKFNINPHIRGIT
jgi:hypothetical protein